MSTEGLRPSRVVVLGAGLAGLAAADRLAESGVEVRVLEREDHPGGLATTIREGAFHFDLGPHRYYTSRPELLRFVRNLLPGSLLEKERLSRIRLLGRYFRYPPALGDILRRMPPHRSAAMILSYLGERIRSVVTPPGEADFESWVVRRFGRRLYEIYFGPYTKKLWGLPPAELSADWAGQRITVPGLAGIIRATLFPGRSKSRTLVGTFHYPRGGIGRIAGALAERIENRGGRIQYRSELRRITRRVEKGGFLFSANGGQLEADAVVNSLPVTDYVQLLGDLVPEPVHRAASGLRFRALVLTALRLSKRLEARDHWIYVPEASFRFNRLSIPGNFDPDASEHGSQVVFETTCREGDEVWAGRRDLAEEAVEGGVRLGLFERGHVLESLTARAAHAYPIYGCGYAARTATVLDALDALEDSVTCGRQGLFRYNNMDHSLEMGRCAAEELLGMGRVRDRFAWTSDTWADG
ncbi:MAG: FAD-dependent oxidoreductase [Acidobacteria bacterium]|nr:FAD-dependent oxidoreductase [Acidobacteriota bacterium]